MIGVFVAQQEVSSMHCLLPRPRRLITDRVWVERSRARSRAAVGTALSSGRSLCLTNNLADPPLQDHHAWDSPRAP